MKARLLSLIIAITCSLATYCQQPDSKDIQELVNVCRQIVEQNNSIEQLNDSIKTSEQKLVTLRQSWKKTCEEYLQSSDQCAEDLDNLISKTDQKFDGTDIYNRLVDALHKIKNNDQNHPRVEPVNTVITTPIVAEDSDSKAVDRDEVKTKSEDASKTKSTKKADDINDMNGMKSKIKNKEDNH